jgi:hypothetical protein
MRGGWSDGLADVLLWRPGAPCRVGRGQAGGQLDANRVVSGRFPLFNSYYLQACGEWLEGSTRAVGTRADFLLGAILAGAGTRVQIQHQQPGKWSLGREHGAAGCIIRGWVRGCAVMGAARMP